MRRILVDHARARLTEKRGSGGAVVSLDEAIDVSDERAEQLLALDEALKRLADLDPQTSRWMPRPRAIGVYTNLCAGGTADISR